MVIPSLPDQGGDDHASIARSLSTSSHRGSSLTNQDINERRSAGWSWDRRVPEYWHLNLSVNIWEQAQSNNAWPPHEAGLVPIYRCLSQIQLNDRLQHVSDARLIPSDWSVTAGEDLPSLQSKDKWLLR